MTRAINASRHRVALASLLLLLLLLCLPSVAALATSQASVSSSVAAQDPPVVPIVPPPPTIPTPPVAVMPPTPPPPIVPPTPPVVVPPQLAIAGSLKVKQHSLVQLTATGIDPKAKVRWRVAPRSNVSRAIGPNHILQFTAPPGVYSVDAESLKVLADGEIDVQEVSVTVTIEAPPPPPAPVPVPPIVLPPGLPPPIVLPRADPTGAIGQIRFGRSACTATVIWPRRPDGRWDILTASHCLLAVGMKGTCKLSGGKVLKVTVSARDPRSDGAWLVTDDPHDTLPFAYLAAKLPPKDTPIWHRGYGVDRPGNHEVGTVAIDGVDGIGQLAMRISVSSGDSGCGLFRTDTNEVVATLYGTRRGRLGMHTVGAACTTCWSIRPKSTAAVPEEVIEEAPGVVVKIVVVTEVGCEFSAKLKADWPKGFGTISTEWVRNSQEITDLYGITKGTPTVIALDASGKEVAREVGYATKKYYEAWLAKLPRPKDGRE